LHTLLKKGRLASGRAGGRSGRRTERRRGLVIASDRVRSRLEDALLGVGLDGASNGLVSVFGRVSKLVSG